ncbi:membrane protein [Camelimonas fluminis]|uniref:TIGR02302 family protein n=1 Tax=Camelimonas fluminis TaxID=1576911 RepID=A0ABV7UPD4_9HYPH|nr:TIGR02302 family protein [Camelimonas fluminis]GHE64976.1 membrane protein [Camelimonas fluminis]
MTATPPSGPRADAPGATATSRRSDLRLKRLTRLSQAALFWERLWPALWPLAGVVLLYLAASLAGLWEAAPPALTHVLRSGFLVAAVAALWPLTRLRWPGRDEALARLDRSAPALARARIASAYADAQATGLADPTSQALWRRHQAMLERQLAALRLRAPVVRMADRDRRALRAIPVLALVTAAFVAGPDWRNRLASGFTWTWSMDLAAENARRLDGWIDPPRYTRRPPVMLDLTSGSAQAAPARVPVNSILVVQAAGGDGLTVSAGSGLTPVASEAGDAAPAGLQRVRYRITGDGEASIRAGGGSHVVQFQAIADQPPKVALKGKPSGGARGSLTIAYTATDDYGLASGRAEIKRTGGGEGRSLAEPPDIPLNLPANPGDGAELRTVAELASHPWAGAQVSLTLTVRDDAGQEGRSETVTLTLPERTFADPLARALVEQRRDLILTPDVRARVQTALDALLIAPELFTPQSGIYLGLRRVAEQLRHAEGDPALVDVAEQLWQLALVIEDGDLSDAEKQLRQAQQALRDAIERGAGEEEIRRLSQELRRAMDRYVAEMGRQARSRPQQPGDANAQTITQDDLQKLLDRIEELTRLGQREEAARLLDRLRQLMENLRTASPSQGGGQGGRQGGDQGAQGEAGRRLGKALGDLDELMRQQQALRDETFRQGQQGQDGENGQTQDDEGQDGSRSQQGRPGGRNEGARPGERPGERQGQGPHDGRGRQGQHGQKGGGQGEKPGQPDATPGDLRQRQEALRRQLEELQQQLKRDGAETGKGFGDADREMRGAGDALGRESPGEAVDSQGRALDEMRRGAQDLARQMAEADGKGRGQDRDGQDRNGEQPGARGTNGGGPETDPLGRPLRGQDRGAGQMESGEPGEAAGARARRILDELRRRLGDSERSREELDYLERLLGPR